MASCGDIGQALTEKDHEVLRALEDFQVVYPSEGSNHFRLVFTFSDNPFFENKTLWKEFEVPRDIGQSLQQGSAENNTEVFNKIKTSSSDISWKDGVSLKNLEEEVEATGDSSVPSSWSFFKFFSEKSTHPDIDLRLALSLKDKLYDNPVHFYQQTVWGAEQELGKENPDQQ